MKKTAIILGATGLTGSILLNYALKDPQFEKIILFSRNTIGKNQPKIEEHLIDLFELDLYAASFQADVVFCCVGTTLAKTPDRETYRKIDLGIPVEAAQLSKRNAIPTFVVISAMGADASSRVFYNRTKGEMEHKVLAQGIKNTYILQPSLIGGSRKEKRYGEKMAQFFMGFFDFMVPKKYKMIAPETIAKAMIDLSNNGFEQSIITSDHIKEIAQRK